MAETASSRRLVPPDAVSPESARPDEGAVRGNGSRVAVPTRDDQPTVISSRPTVLPGGAVTDSAYRILRGDILPGDRLEHFELIDYVGGGGMGRVFRGIDTRLARPVALKILSPDQAADPETLARFQNEAQSAARLDHENIARVFHVGEDRGLHYIVFEFIEGENVRALVEKRGPLPLAEALGYTLQVADALAHAAARQVVHRDIKPSNLLITPEGRVKLIDMGLARLRQPNPSAADLTATGVTLGTFDYISPEQARDPRNADVRSDIYSLGCTFFYMLTGRPPFPEGTVLQKLLQHQADQPPDIRHFRPDLPEEVGHVMRKMLAKDPRGRYRDPEQLVTDLVSAARRTGLQPSGPGSRIWIVPQPPALSRLQQHLPWLAPVAVLVAIVLLLNHLWSSQAERLRPSPLLPVEAGVPAPGETPEDESPTAADTVDPPDAVAPPDSGRGPGPGAPAAPGDTPSAGGNGSGGGPTPRAAPVDPSAPDPSAPGHASGEAALEGRLTVADFAEGLGGAPAGGAVLPGRLSAAISEATMGRPADGDLLARRPGVLVVNGTTTDRQQFASLGAAVRAAIDGDVIELRYDGPREEKPIRLARHNLTIRAGEGFQPAVAFLPDDADPVKYPRNMVVVAASGLRIVDVAIQLSLPREMPADHWSLFEVRGPHALRLTRCWLTIRNASDRQTVYHQEVAFFRGQSPPAAEPRGDAAVPSATAAIDLADCVLRGEAAVIDCDGSQSATMSIRNAFIAVSEPVVALRGDSGRGGSGEALHVELYGATVVARGGLCRLGVVGQPSSALPRLRLLAAECIVIGAAGSPMVSQVGSGPLGELRSLLAFSGLRNFYERIDVFWQIDGPETSGVVQQWDFEAWREFWGSTVEQEPSRNRLQWKAAPPTLPLHAHVPADYEPLPLPPEMESKPAETPAAPPGDTRPGESKPADTRPNETKPGETPATSGAQANADGKTTPQDADPTPGGELIAPSDGVGVPAGVASGQLPPPPIAEKPPAGQPPPTERSSAPAPAPAASAPR